MYWSEDKIPRLRPTFTLTHIVVYTPPSGTPLVARKQIYASQTLATTSRVYSSSSPPSMRRRRPARPTCTS